LIEILTYALLKNNEITALNYVGVNLLMINKAVWIVDMFLLGNMISINRPLSHVTFEALNNFNNRLIFV
jgi:hypothetical protein